MKNDHQLLKKKTFFGQCIETTLSIGSMFRVKKKKELFESQLTAYDFFAGFKRPVHLSSGDILIYNGLRRNSFLMSFHTFLTERGQMIIISHVHYSDDCLEKI